MFKVGDQVIFGRMQGEHTKGVVVKINPKTIAVRQTEARSGHPVGTMWRVAPSFVQPAGGPAVAPVAKRPEREIMREVAGIYCDLSPENLTCDGEASPAWVRSRSRQLNARLAACFKELGRRVDESECYHALLTR